MNLAYLQTGHIWGFRKSVVALFFRLSNKCCNFICFIFSKVFWVQFYSPSTSTNTVPHYYHIMLNFCLEISNIRISWLLAGHYVYVEGTLKYFKQYRVQVPFKVHLLNDLSVQQRSQDKNLTAWNVVMVITWYTYYREIYQSGSTYHQLSSQNHIDLF